MGGVAVGDRIYRGVTTLAGLAIVALLLYIAVEVFTGGWPVFRKFGLGFLTSSAWDPVHDVYGAAPAIFGTLVSSAIALVIATPLAVGTAVFLSELAPRWLGQPIAFLVDLLAAIPSVVYGLWGIFVLEPMMRDSIAPFLQNTLHLGGLPIFDGVSYGPGMLAAGIILAIMILPYISAVTREVLMAVPRSQREAAFALGATRWEMIRDAVIPGAKSGIVGGIVLGLGRALGETMAVTMVIGNAPTISASLFASGYTMASIIANEFAEAAGLHISALLAIGATLLAVTLVVNVLARWLVARVGVRYT
ncbi:MAG: phosphate ABC transporter permease subunit PstC [Gemmatimonadota bacterium]|nr:phosphate ABC transporter permease subunit PstC [Gemmatimonadota bacterium]MDE3127760.1 phosphate ABC transporter permease subunit PstC [Gemmatimonadota bacterium]MDE3172244.1 phosphate ABC transporter permease subunit PstC [Gemmatimonadota bacterium]MDE3215033.1 phosphate ABC transporter permease subunit PstC [Gemmatimonadota bacterium]